MSFRGSHFVEELNRYTTVSSDHEAAFDEYISTRKSEAPLKIETRTEAFVRDHLGGARPSSIILTGNAGDGKTHLCRQIIHELTGTVVKEWPPDVDYPIQHEGGTLHVVKDLSEVSEEKGREIIERLEATLQDDSSDHFLIAANEGRLRAILSRSGGGVPAVEAAVEQQLVEEADPTADLIVINLNRVATSALTGQILEWISAPERWEACEECEKHHECPIRFNAEQLGKPRVAKRIRRLYQAIEHLGQHLTVRDALIHLAYTTTAGRSCEETRSQGAPPPQDVAYHQNVWAPEAPKTFREKSAVVHALDPLDPAKSSVFHLDDAVVNGRIDTLTGTEWGERLDLGNKQFEQDRASYLKGYEVAGNRKPALLQWLPRLRRKLFFELKDEAKALGLLPFLFADDYFALLEGRRDAHDYVPRLILGLNRALTDLYLSDDSHLYVTAQYANSADQPVPVIRLKVQRDNVKLLRDATPSAAVDRDEAQLVLDVLPPAALMMEMVRRGEVPEPVTWPLNLLLFEYLLRRAQGATPEVLAHECGLAVRQFRDRLLTAFTSHPSTGQIAFFAAKDNHYVIRTIELTDGSHATLRVL
jgi:hypothetical protein